MSWLYYELMEIRGKVVSGLGEGQLYVQKYLSYFEGVLGMTCYPGTMNIKVDKIPDLGAFKKYTITPEEKDLAAVDCYMVQINGEFDGAIVIPHKTRHGNEVVEVIAPVNLREELKLKDGDEVVCELV